MYSQEKKSKCEDFRCFFFSKQNYDFNPEISTLVSKWSIIYFFLNLALILHRVGKAQRRSQVSNKTGSKLKGKPCTCSVFSASFGKSVLWLCLLNQTTKQEPNLLGETHALIILLCSASSPCLLALFDSDIITNGPDDSSEESASV